jgi:hypothetical protein
MSLVIHRKLFLAAAVNLFMITAAHAAEIETLFMPGQVISGHAKYESDCSRCHARFEKKTQDRLCRDCHEEIDRDISTGSGFHGLAPGLKDQRCKSCHTDHIGRDAGIVLLNSATFDHDATDFRLLDSHLDVSCTACHQRDRKHSEAPNDCYGCHREQDPHKGNLGKQCDDCHLPRSWDDFDYDHDTTDFPLRGKHNEVLCSSCHLNEQYEKTPQDCNSCHYLNDVHSGRNGTKCHDCHNIQQWDESKFNHDRDTEFRLRGKHSDIRCEACHLQALSKAKPEKDCYSCHRNDDRHKGRYGKECHSCHTETTWQRAEFDHERNTDFPLKGGHTDLACSACHRGALGKEDLSTSCYDCHASDDVHRGQEGEGCQRCHQESGWSEKVVFDHDLTAFPLIGLHASTPCEECHLTTAFQDAETHCYACHEADDEHKSTLGEHCASCHNPNAWGLWIFDHNQQTEFELDGGHEDLICRDCHREPVEKTPKQSSRCYTCHSDDDEHHGRFGRNCQRCHATSSFSEVTISH